MPRRHAVLVLVVAVFWALNLVVIDIGLESFPPLLFAALRFGLIAFPAVFFVPRPDVRWLAVVAVGLFISVSADRDHITGTFNVMSGTCAGTAGPFHATYLGKLK
jgi:drug/metabolite transporter (DMT)-like permease